MHNYLLPHPCVSCGETDPVVLEFRPLHSKEMAIAQMVTRVTSIDWIDEELKKTEVLCATCHRKLTTKERSWVRGRK